MSLGRCVAPKRLCSIAQRWFGESSIDWRSYISSYRNAKRRDLLFSWGCTRLWSYWRFSAVGRSCVRGMARWIVRLCRRNICFRSGRWWCGGWLFIEGSLFFTLVLSICKALCVSSFVSIGIVSTLSFRGELRGVVIRSSFHVIKSVLEPCKITVLIPSIRRKT